MENSFDTKAATWDENPRRLLMVEKVEAIISSQIKLSPEMKLLDYGCGTGLLGFKFVDRLQEVTFYDTSSGMLDQVKSKISYYGIANAQILLADYSTKEEPYHQYHIITSMLVLHHVVDLPTLVEKFNHSLFDDGLFCWIDIDKEDGSFHGDPSIPHLGFSRVEMEVLLKQKGFEIIFYSKEIQIEKETENGIRHFPLFVLIAKKSRK